MTPSVYYSASIKSLLQKLSQQQIDHMIGVGLYAGIMAKKISDCRLYSKELDRYEIEQISEAAFYHDVGKVWLPREFLSKSEQLTSQERLIVTQHTLLAMRLFNYIDNRIISGVPGSLIALSCDAAVYHHEHWDGSGYPFGLCGDNIPLIARITAICDCYDKETALKGSSHQTACRIIEQGKGTRFDPGLAHVFVRYNSEFAAAYNGYRNSDWF
ncbi:MAG: HD domain-containing phosphohydrolase [Candidatus Fimivivens sp.]|nr:HD domain-containing phosphohydrolase [Candidatus Fimivivens sp.]